MSGIQCWRVKGGKTTGGIMVRTGEDTKSSEATSRLSTGAIVKELALKGERLQYELLTGTGPQTGWVSLKLKNNELMVKEATPKGMALLGPIEYGHKLMSAKEKAKGRIIWLIPTVDRHEVQSFIWLGKALKQSGYTVRVFGPAHASALAQAFGVPYTDAGKRVQDYDSISYAESVLDMAWQIKQALADEEAVPDLVIHEVRLLALASHCYTKCGCVLFPVWFRLPDARVLDEVMLIDEICGAAFEYRELEPHKEDVLGGYAEDPRMMCPCISLEIETLEEGDSKNQYKFSHSASFTGSWWMPEEVQLSIVEAADTEELASFFGNSASFTELKAFVEKGKAPVYVGWTKVPEGKSKDLLRLLVLALKKASVRAVVFPARALVGSEVFSAEMLQAAAGEGDSEGLCAYAKGNIHFINTAAPHEWLLPRCSCAMVHTEDLKGSSGIAGLCLRHAVPMISCPLGESHTHYDGLLSKMGIGVVCPPLSQLTADELLDAINRAPSFAGTCKGFIEAKPPQEMGVVSAAKKMHDIMLNEVVSGLRKREWEEDRRKQEDAAETDGETEDGVYRPPPLKDGEDTMKKSKAKEKAPAWLDPDVAPGKDGDKGRILVLTVPLKGHAIHLIRVAAFFAERPNYSVHVVCSTEFVKDLPKGCEITTYEHSESFELIDENLCGQAGLDTTPDKEEALRREKAAKSDETTEQIYGMMRAVLEPFASWKPHVVITDQAMKYMPIPNFIPAVCKVYKAELLLVVSPSIKENRIRQGKARAKLDLRLAELAAEAAQQSDKPAEEAPQETSKPEDQDIMSAMLGGEKPDIKTDEMGIPIFPFMPKAITQMKLLQIFGQMPKCDATPPVLIFPGSTALYKVHRYDNELFPGPFGVLPQPENGSTQFGRDRFESTIGKTHPELLNFIFKEGADPVVYIAYGTIVSKFLSKAIVERVIEGILKTKCRAIFVLPKKAQEYVPAGVSPDVIRIETFVPQGDVLRCKPVKAFISHCGANSTMEAMASGVPVVCMPFYMDQFDWAFIIRRYCRAGVMINCHAAAETIHKAVNDVLTTPAYGEGAVAVSKNLAEQSDSILSFLGPKMKPKARLGPGVCITAAIIVAICNGKKTEDIVPQVQKVLGL